VSGAGGGGCVAPFQGRDEAPDRFDVGCRYWFGWSKQRGLASTGKSPEVLERAGGQFAVDLADVITIDGESVSRGCSRRPRGLIRTLDKAAKASLTSVGSDDTCGGRSQRVDDAASTARVGRLAAKAATTSISSATPTGLLTCS